MWGGGGKSIPEGRGEKGFGVHVLYGTSLAWLGGTLVVTASHSLERRVGPLDGDRRGDCSFTS